MNFIKVQAFVIYLSAYFGRVSSRQILSFSTINGWEKSNGAFEISVSEDAANSELISTYYMDYNSHASARYFYPKSSSYYHFSVKLRDNVESPDLICKV